MTQEKFKQLVSAALTFGALSIPGFSDWLHASGGTAEVMTLTGALFVVIHGIYSKMHDKAVTAFAGAVVLAILIPASANAQEPGGDVPTGAIAHKDYEFVAGPLDQIQEYALPPHPVIGDGEPCARVGQRCVFSASENNANAFRYQWEAGTEHARIYGPADDGEFVVIYRRPSPREGTVVRLKSKRLDTPGGDWFTRETTIHLSRDGLPRWAKLAITAGLAYTGARLARADPPSHATRDRWVGAGIGAAVAGLAFGVDWQF